MFKIKTQYFTSSTKNRKCCLQLSRVFLMKVSSQYLIGNNRNKGISVFSSLVFWSVNLETLSKSVSIDIEVNIATTLNMKYYCQVFIKINKSILELQERSFREREGPDAPSPSLQATRRVVWDKYIQWELIQKSSNKKLLNEMDHREYN